MERSSSGLGHHLFRVNIKGSNPLRFTFFSQKSTDIRLQQTKVKKLHSSAQGT